MSFELQGRYLAKQLNFQLRQNYFIEFAAQLAAKVIVLERLFIIVII